MKSATDFDVIVVGGGPAGSTTSTLIAQQGYRVLLIEKSSEPTLKVGESLMPATYWTFERLGLLEKLRASHFPTKSSVQFYSSDGRGSSPFYFSDHDPHESSQTWQVERSEFDHMMRQNAADQGVELNLGTTVKEVLFDGGRAVGVRVHATPGVTREVSSKVVVDATGQSALLARKLGIREVSSSLRHCAFFSHFEGMAPSSGRDQGATVIYHTQDKKSWFWLIPLPNRRSSAGVVGDVSYLVEGRRSSPQAIFEEELDLCPALKPLLQKAKQSIPVQVLRDFSYKAREVAGDGWVLVGDAFGFIDPIYSSGVFLALKSGEMAADAICTGLENDDLSAQQLGSFGPDLSAGMDSLRQLVYAFYNPNFSFGAFLKRNPDCSGELVDLLMGNVYRRPVDRLLTALAEFQNEPAPEVAEVGS
jgi:flavin-dependent dehydrogenase